jgi:hypothetical protein
MSIINQIYTTINKVQTILHERKSFQQDSLYFNISLQLKGISIQPKAHFHHIIGRLFVPTWQMVW